MAEYITSGQQNVLLNQPAVFDASIPCRNGFVFHEDGSGIFTLCGKTSNCFARYQITFNGNVSLPEGGTVVPIAVALAVNGETKLTSRAIVTPAAVEEFFNVTSTAIITVPKGCCYSVSLRAVPASDDPSVTPAPVIVLQDGNLDISRIA
jgi:hypothetical protein